MQQIDMSVEKPMVSAVNPPRVRYSAAYPHDAPEKALLSEGSRTKCARRYGPTAGRFAERSR